MSKQMTIGQAIKQGMHSRGMTQKDLATELGISPANLSGWINDKVIPPGDKLLEIIRHLELLPFLFPDAVKFFADDSEEQQQKKMIKSRLEFNELSIHNLELKKQVLISENKKLQQFLDNQ